MDTDAFEIDFHNKISSAIITVFFSTFFLGLLTHFYFMVNKLPSPDDVTTLFSDLRWADTLGRWFTWIPAKIRGTTSTPWLYGTLGLFYLALANCFLVRLFDIQNKIVCFLIAGITVTFPSITCMFSYEYMFDVYCLSILFDFSAAYLIAKKSWGWSIPAVILIACSIGIYQSHFSFVCGVLLLYLMIEDLENKRSTAELFSHAIRFLITLSAGLGLYWIVLKFSSRHTPLTSYQNINNMGHITPGNILPSVKDAYLRLFGFFFKNERGVNLSFSGILLEAVLIICLFLAIKQIVQNRLSLGKILLFCLFTALFPLAINLIYVMAYGSKIHMVVFHSAVLLLILPAVWSDKIKPSFKKKKYLLWLQSGITAVLCIFIYNYIVLANKAYESMDLSYKLAMSFSTRLVERIEEFPDYSIDKQVILVGYASSVPGTTPINYSKKLDQMTGMGPKYNIIDAYNYANFLQNYCGFGSKYINYYRADLTGRLSPDEISQVDAMPVYPQQGSIQEVGKAILVKFHQP